MTAKRGDEAGLAPTTRPEPSVPAWLRRWAGISWRALVVLGAIVVIGLAFAKFELILLPVIVALFVTTILGPPTWWLERHGWPRLLATWTIFLAAAGIIAGIIVGLVPTIRGEFSGLGGQLTHAQHQIEHWLETGPLHLSQHSVNNYVNDVKKTVKSNQSTIVHGAISGVTIALETTAALLLTAFLTFFFTKDARRIGDWFFGLLSTDRAEDTRSLFSSIGDTLKAYVRGTALNGAVNATVLSVGLAIIGVPLIPVIALLTFVGGFLPIVGAIVSGGIAALVALVTKGPIAALIVIGLTAVVHNLEGYVVGPFVLGRSVHMHPVAVILALSVGGVLDGIVGAFIAVPVVASLLTTIEHYRKQRLMVASPTQRGADSKSGEGDRTAAFPNGRAGLQ